MRFFQDVNCQLYEKIETTYQKKEKWEKKGTLSKSRRNKEEATCERRQWSSIKPQQTQYDSYIPHLYYCSLA